LLLLFGNVTLLFVIVVVLCTLLLSLARSGSFTID